MIPFLPREAKHQRFRPRAVDQRALLLLDRQLAFLRCVDRQRCARLDVGRGLAWAARQRITTQGAALLVGVRHLRPPHIRGSGVDRPVIVGHQPPVLPRLLHPAAGEAGMGRVLAFAHAFHAADSPIKLMISLVIQLIRGRVRATLIARKRCNSLKDATAMTTPRRRE